MNNLKDWSVSKWVQCRFVSLKCLHMFGEKYTNAKKAAEIRNSPLYKML